MFFAACLLLILADFPGSTVIKIPPANTSDTGDAGSVPGLERYPEAANGNPLLEYIIITAVSHAKIASAAVLMTDHFLSVQNKHSILIVEIHQELHSNGH